jgi:hypothetical protein
MIELSGVRLQISSGSNFSHLKYVVGEIEVSDEVAGEYCCGAEECLWEASAADAKGAVGHAECE